MICGITAAYYAAFGPFVSLAKTLIIDKWGMDPYIASVCTGVVYDVPLVFAIFFGKFVDMVGLRLTLLIIACLLELAVHVIFLTC